MKTIIWLVVSAVVGIACFFTGRHVQCAADAESTPSKMNVTMASGEAPGVIVFSIDALSLSGATNWHQTASVKVQASAEGDHAPIPQEDLRITPL